MCPISQAKAAETLHDENLDILGWYHSHPTFAPEPSQQDIETQLSVQQWIGNRVPCIGFILSPFSLHGALIASPYRCMIVNRMRSIKQDGDCHKEDVDEEQQLVPYKFKVDLIVERLNVGQLIERAKQVFRDDRDNIEKEIKSRVDFGKVYFQDNTITYLDKVSRHYFHFHVKMMIVESIVFLQYIYSVKMHLAKCSGINKMTCDAIINGLTRICMHYSTVNK